MVVGVDAGGLMPGGGSDSIASVLAPASTLHQVERNLSICAPSNGSVR